MSEKVVGLVGYQIWVQLSLILSLVGNTLVLYGTSHRAIRLDKLSVWIIQNLAAADIMNSMLLMIPVLITLYNDGNWVLGHTFCLVMFVYKYTGCVANMVLMNCLSINKLLRCLYPLRRMTVSTTQRYVVTIVTGISSGILPLWACYGAWVGHTVTVVYSSLQFMCTSEWSDNVTSWHLAVGYVLAVLLNGAPCLLLCLVNVVLVGYALSKSTRPVNKMSIVMMVGLTTTFLVPWLPFFVYYVTVGNIAERDSSEIRIVTMVIFIASWTNFPVYLLTNKQFRDFTLGLVHRTKSIRRHSSKLERGPASHQHVKGDLQTRSQRENNGERKDEIIHFSIALKRKDT